MAMSKIERIEKEIQKTREKITEYQNKLRGLEAQKTEAENLQIVQLVRSMRLTPQELTAMLAGGGIPGIAPIHADYEEQEETENPRTPLTKAFRGYAAFRDGNCRLKGNAGRCRAQMAWHSRHPRRDFGKTGVYRLFGAKKEQESCAAHAIQRCGVPDYRSAGTAAIAPADR